jgi:hypothetical protein
MAKNQCFPSIKIRTSTICVRAYTTRTGLRADGGDGMAIGSLAISSTDGRAHIKVAHNEADADWRKITVSDAD